MEYIGGGRDQCTKGTYYMWVSCTIKLYFVPSVKIKNYELERNQNIYMNSTLTVPTAGYPVFRLYRISFNFTAILFIYAGR